MFTGEDYKTSFVPALVIFTLAVCTVLIISQNPFFIMTFFFFPVCCFFFLHVNLLHNAFFFCKTGRKREWFKIDDAIQVLQCHKPVQATYFEALQESCLTSNGTPLVTTIGGDLSPTYSINQSSVSGIR